MVSALILAIFNIAVHYFTYVPELDIWGDGTEEPKDLSPFPARGQPALRILLSSPDLSPLPGSKVPRDAPLSFRLLGLDLASSYVSLLVQADK